MQSHEILSIILQCMETAMDEYMEDRVMRIYKCLMTKEFFMSSFTGFEEFKQMGPNLGNVVLTVIKNVKKGLHGTECSDEEAEALASRAWQKLIAEYQADE